MGKGANLLIYIVFMIFCGCEKNDTQHCFQYAVIGETITLADQQWNELWKQDITNLVLYKIEPNGAKFVYEQDRDYLVRGNQIKRTPNSRITDFIHHHVIYDDNGKFQWLSEPNRNPELTLPYQICADYNYTDDSESIQPSNNASQLLKDKITRRQPLKLVTIGTSISFGAHTFENYYHDNDFQTYHQLISKSLLSYYGLNCISINYSIDGGGVNQIQNVAQIINEKPDVVFLELGMNDHLGENPNSSYYKASLEQSIVEFKKHKIDVVLIGFFQQIESWELENSSNTVLYNMILRGLSQKYEIYFADIYSCFEKIDKNKLYKDYTGDYMHHPTSFAHQLYYLEIMPFFIDKPINKNDLLQYLYR